MHVIPSLIMGEDPSGYTKDHAANPLIPHLPEFIFSLVIFLLVWWVIQTKVTPSLDKAYAERAAAIDGDMHKAEAALAEAEQMKRDYEANLASARAEAAKVREEAHAQGAAIVEEARATAQAEHDRIVGSAYRQIEADRQHALVSLRSEVGHISTVLAGKIVGESLQDDARHKGIIERFLQDLEAGAIQPVGVGSVEGSVR